MGNKEKLGFYSIKKKKKKSLFKKKKKKFFFFTNIIFFFFQSLFFLNLERLLNGEGDMLAYAGEDMNSNNMVSAIVSNIWQSFQNKDNSLRVMLYFCEVKKKKNLKKKNLKKKKIKKKKI